jgi:hypothetical protein
MTHAERGGKRGEISGLDGNLGPARPITPSQSRWLVDRAVNQVLARRSTSHSRVVNIRSIALAAIVVTASAAAATIAHQRYYASTRAAGPELEMHESAASHVPSHPNSAASAVSQDIPAETVPNATPSNSPVHSAPSVAQSTATVAVADRLAAANELRRAGQWRRAERAYLDIAARYPSVPQASVASLAAASLRLEHLADPAGALQLYKSLTRVSALGVEALYGVARCHQALGDKSAEIAALHNVIAAYPTSLQADRARERLQQIASTSAAP